MSTTLPSPPPVDAAGLLARYDQEGYVHLGRVMEEDELLALRGEEARLRRGQDLDPGASSRVVFINNVCWRSSPLRRFVHQGGHLAAVRAILGDDLLLWWTQLVTKLPDMPQASSVFPWHQDGGYVDVAPCPLTVWVALDDVGPDNGCVWVIPGSHRDGLRAHTKPSADSWHMTVEVNEDGVPVTLAAGEAIAFNAHTLHRSLSNRTQAPRRAFFCSYALPWARESLTNRPILPDRDLQMISGQARGCTPA